MEGHWKKKKKKKKISLKLEPMHIAAKPPIFRGRLGETERGRQADELGDYVYNNSQKHFY
jgi:hypothetical protein